MLDEIQQTGANLQKQTLNWLGFLNIDYTSKVWLVATTTTIAIILLSFLSFFMAKRYLLNVIERRVKRGKSTWIKLLFDRYVLSRLLHLLPAFIIYICAPLMKIAPTVFSLSLAKIYRDIAFSYMILAVFYSLYGVLNVIHDYHRDFKLASYTAIKTYIEIAKIILLIIAGILVISILLHKSPVYLLTSIGAVATIFVVGFKDTLLGFVANVQMVSGDLVRVGDWIEAPQLNICGTILEIYSSRVKIENFDKTITIVSTNILLNTTLKNWRGMYETGARRITNNFYINLHTIKFCDNDFFMALKEKKILTDNLYETLVQNNHSKPTNLSAFRVYLQHYIENHPKIHQHLLRIVRYLEPNVTGLPVQIYIFSNETKWAIYERIQAEIIEHILAILPEFQLASFQERTDKLEHLYRAG
ncbi:MAG: mechanosensitive ion channel family protein [Gammaproteobacteria bacterium]